MSSPKRAVMYTGGSGDLCIPLRGVVTWMHVEDDDDDMEFVDDGDGPSLQTPRGKYLSTHWWHTMCQVLVVIQLFHFFNGEAFYFFFTLKIFQLVYSALRFWGN